jgi:hypothetical protein
MWRSRQVGQAHIGRLQGAKEKEEGKTSSSKAKDRDRKPPEATANPMQVAGMAAVYPDDNDF